MTERGHQRKPCIVWCHKWNVYWLKIRKTCLKKHFLRLSLPELTIKIDLMIACKLVLILDGHSEHVAIVWRKTGIYFLDNSNLWLLSIWTNALTRARTPRSLRTCVPISELPSNTFTPYLVEVSDFGNLVPEVAHPALVLRIPGHGCINVLGAPEITANLCCNFAYLYWEGCVICSIHLRYYMVRPVYCKYVFSYLPLILLLWTVCPSFQR